jgi:hypothetical protein
MLNLFLCRQPYYPEVKSKFQYKDESDFLLGFTYARIIFISAANYQNKVGRKIKEEEQEQPFPIFQMLLLQ